MQRFSDALSNFRLFSEIMAADCIISSLQQIMKHRLMCNSRVTVEQAIGRVKTLWKCLEHKAWLYFIKLYIDM